MSAAINVGGPPMHNDSDLIARLAAELAKQLRPALPIEIDLWDIATIATYLKRSESVVRERMACLPDFPKAIRLPSTRSVRGQALYRAKEVIQWAARYQDKN
jgi:hypothetical protein